MKKTIVALLLIASMLTSLFVMPTGAEESIADSYTHVNAEFEDSDISLWFDYASEKVSDSTVQNTGKESYLVYMAKNEIEDAQFFLSSVTDKSGLTADITEFTDGNGNSVKAELFIEYYHDCDDYGMVPDAIPPLSAYGAFDLAAGKSQGFIIKLTTTAETVAGDYSAKLSVYDAEGREVKTTTVYAHVWNFALSEETACATSINLDRNYLSKAHGVAANSSEADVLYKTYYNYMLENRVSAYYLPENPYSSAAAEYMDNPRVTSFQFANKSGGELNALQLNNMFKTNFNVEGGEERLKKGYYFAGVVDADEPHELEALKAAYDTFSSKYQSKTDIPLSFISTYFFDIDYTLEDGTVIDQIKYYEDFVNLWCSKPFGYTSPEELSIHGAKVLQPLKWNDVYGTFSERMAAQRAEGDKVWWFLAWDVEAPYINYFMQTDGTAQRVLFWQQFDHDVQGFLYNFVNFWIMENNDPYASNITNSKHPDAHGESVLIYPGTRFGIEGPVGSLRFEAMRDGIEDYQMFTMLEELKGEGAADAIIDKMTTGVVSYSTDGASYYEARAELGRKVEAAVNGTDSDVPFENFTLQATSEIVDGKLYVYYDIYNNPGIWSVLADLSFNEKALELVEVINGNVFADEFYTESPVMDGTHRYFAALEDVENCHVNGRLVTYVFDILNSTKSFDIVIAIDPENVFNCDFEDQELTIVNEADKGGYELETAVGDVNGDGMVNTQDLFRMKLIMMTIVEPTTEERASADINGDGLVNASDVFALSYRILYGKWV